MIQRRGRTRFLSKSRQSLGVPGYGVRKELKGNKPPEPSILSFVDHTHSTFGKKTHNPETSGNDLIGFEDSLSARPAPKGCDFTHRTLQESIGPIMLAKQALHFAAQGCVPSTGFRQ
jgi:hypothetical protein